MKPLDECSREELLERCEDLFREKEELKGELQSLPVRLISYLADDNGNDEQLARWVYLADDPDDEGHLEAWDLNATEVKTLVQQFHDWEQAAAEAYAERRYDNR